MVGAQQTGATRHDAVPVRVGIVPHAMSKRSFEAGERCHGVRRRAVHANLAVPIGRREGERRIHPIVHQLYVDAVTFDN